MHGGTLFDYVFVIEKSWNSKKRTRIMVQQYLKGLLNLISGNEGQSHKNITIKGTSYFISEKTASRLGFTKGKLDYAQKLILTFNYVNLLISNSLAKKRLAFPKISKTKTYKAHLADLIQNKSRIEAIYNSLNK